MDVVTDADLRAWNPFGCSREHEPDFRLSISERRKRYGFGKKKEAKVKIVAEKPPRKNAAQPKPKPITEAAKQRYEKTQSAADAVVRALDLVTAKLGYDLSAYDTHERRVKRIEGWHIFCQAVSVLYPSYSVRGISDAITVPNAPSRPTLGSMFDNCRECSPYSYQQIKAMLGKE